MKVGDKIEVKDNLLNESVRGTVIQVEPCFFKVCDNWNGYVSTFHWNDDIEIKENVSLVIYP